MKRDDLKQLAEEYREKNGFLPGTIILHEDDVLNELLPLLKEVCIQTKYEVYEKMLKEDIKAIERIPIMGMAIVLSEDKKPLYLGRQSGNFTSIRPKDASQSYIPQADILNSMSRIMKASFAFFDKVDNDEAFCEFAKDICVFMDSARNSKDIWERGALPKLDSICEAVAKSPNAMAFFVKFFMCVMDFYWHCTRLTSEDKMANNTELFDKAINISSMCRLMPKDMREDFLDHLASHGMLPNVMSNLP